MDITMLIPLDEGNVDCDCFISAGVEVYRGSLTLAQLVRLATDGGKAYPCHAVVEYYNDDGTFNGVRVTFHNDDKGSEDEAAALTGVIDHWPNGNVRAIGSEYESDRAGTGNLAYITDYTTVVELPESLR